MRSHRPLFVLASLCLFQAGFIAARFLDAPAFANEPAATGLRLLCQHFPVDPATPTPIETADPNSPVGKWIAEKAAGGWALYTLDFAAGTKATGYPQLWVQVCLYPG